ncbi:MAG: AsmA family protein [Methylococcaceae bacterium]
MGKIIKILLSLVAFLVFLVIVAIFVVPHFIDLNDYKDKLQTAVKEQTGRDALIEGDIDLSFFPWLGLETGKLSLSNAPGFGEAPFVSIAESNIKVKILPLLSKKVEIDRLVLKGLQLNLAKNKQGVSNWDDLAKKETQPSSSKNEQPPTPPDEKPSTEEEKSPPIKLTDLAVGGISLEDANVKWDDFQSNQHIAVQDFDLTTGALKLNEPVDVEMDLAITMNEPQLKETIVFNGSLWVNDALNLFKLNNVNLKTVTEGETIPGNKLAADFLAQIEVDKAKQTLNLSKFQMASGKLKLNADIMGEQIIDAPAFNGTISLAEFNLAAFLKSLDIALPAMQKTDALSKAAVQFGLQATQKSANINDLQISFDESKITGTASVNNFSKPAIRYDLTLNAINVDHYLPPKSNKKEGKEKQTTVPKDQSKTKTKSSGLFPVETLKTLNIDGKFKLGQLIASGLKMNEIGLNVLAKNGKLQTNQTIGKLYTGKYTGQINLDVTKQRPSLSLNEKLSGLQIEPLLTDLSGKARISGTTAATIKLNGKGNDIDAIKRTLSGNIDFTFLEGKLIGIDLHKLIKNIEDLIKGKGIPAMNDKASTPFTELKGSVQVNNGLAVNNDLQAYSSSLKINGKGSADLVSEKLDYAVTTKLLKAEANDNQSEKIKGLPLAIKVGGTFSKPTFQPDLEAILKAKYGAKLEREKEKHMKKLNEKVNKQKQKLQEKLNKKLGPALDKFLKF